ncbi:MAG: hypothetical protein M5R40_04660 [Anaerolineae bacterium]|nr:hypothetical protein [Anaerolineae bacterium]
MDYGGRPVLADVRPIPNSPWFMVARIDIAEVYAPLRKRLVEMALLMGGVALRRRRGRAPPLATAERRVLPRAPGVG